MTFLYWIIGTIGFIAGVLLYVRHIINREATNAINNPLGKD